MTRHPRKHGLLPLVLFMTIWRMLSLFWPTVSIRRPRDDARSTWKQSSVFERHTSCEMLTVTI